MSTDFDRLFRSTVTKVNIEHIYQKPQDTKKRTYLRIDVMFVRGFCISNKLSRDLGRATALALKFILFHTIGESFSSL